MLIFSNVLSMPGTLVITCFRTEVFFWKAHRALMGEVDPIACELKMCLCLTAVEHYMPKWMIPSNFAPGEAFFVKKLKPRCSIFVCCHLALCNCAYTSCIMWSAGFFRRRELDLLRRHCRISLGLPSDLWAAANPQICFSLSSSCSQAHR